MLAIWDRRPGASRLLTMLTGHERALYLYCDQAHALGQIVALGGSLGAGPAEAESLLARLVEQRVMIAADGRYLSLAVPASADGGAPTAVELEMVRASRMPQPA
jgi:hypothetical protein